MPPAFKFFGKHVLLTYAQCGTLDALAVERLVGSTGGKCIIGKELHVDGGIHLHCFVQWESEFTTTDKRQFDVGGCHPNFRKMYRTPKKGYAYAIKDGEIVGGTLEAIDVIGDESELSGRDSDSRRKSPWFEIILAESRDEFFESCARLDPRSLCVGFMGLSKYADWKYRVDRSPYSTPGGISIEASTVPALCNWVRENLGPREGGARRVSLCLYGETRLGKTLWARSLGSHAYFGGLFCLDESVTDVDYAVFDDMQGGLEFFHGYKFWLGCQAQFYATDKYKGKKLIDWGRPSIWLSNEDPRHDKNADVDWLNGNCIFVRLLAPIFRANTD
ncbi:MAG: replication-associated protein [Genomoviridae sp.]|uniref:Replication-associated protein n=1 Tax=Genomoviridae sp. TaxID=2202565 RepID=A0A6H1Z7H7_9VIRU|nr:MAG: replication-associated protein [Genomoviridae sp.]QJA43245.1 MAG: replication-associated protein [Genomoviridae sp.]